MKAIIDKAIPYIQGVLEPFFDVEYLPGKDIDRAKAADADVLLIPADECYHAMRNQKAEEALRRFSDQGGSIVNGPDADIVRLAFDLSPAVTSSTCFPYLLFLRKTMNCTR